MGVLFESILLFSLAVLIILVGLLVYYFKKRIVDVEQKNATCLEIVQDVYTQHMKLRNEIYMMIQNEQQHHHTQEQPMPMYQHVHNVTDENRIKIELSDDDDELSEDESEDESEEEISSDEESDSDAEEAQPEPEDKIKVINVDLKIPENFKINEIDEDPEEEPEEEPELKSLEPSDPIIINKVGPADISKQDLKKLTPSALKALLIGKGMSADEVNKMKKADLIKNLM